MDEIVAAIKAFFEKVDANWRYSGQTFHERIEVNIEELIETLELELENPDE